MIKSLNPKKSQMLTDSLLSFLKIELQTFTIDANITYVFNKDISKTLFPEEAKIADITPIHKID